MTALTLQAVHYTRRTVQDIRLEAAARQQVRLVQGTYALILAGEEL